jgi:trans-aconitate methyltransferase
VGGGASALVDHLLARGYKNLSVLDISPAALNTARQRLGDSAQGVEWLDTDILTFAPSHKYMIWHDRAVFHFLTEESDLAAYKQALKNSLVPGGHFIIATFAVDGPKQCSGLIISQYDTASLTRIFGDTFELTHSEIELHRTPWNSEQKFLYCHFRRIS